MYKSWRMALINASKRDLKLIWKNINNLVNRITTPNFLIYKLSSPGKIVQINQTMSNYK